MYAWFIGQPFLAQRLKMNDDLEVATFQVVACLVVKNRKPLRSGCRSNSAKAFLLRSRHAAVKIKISLRHRQMAKAIN
jgi:hypothetical protein